MPTTALAHVATTAPPSFSSTARFAEFCPPASADMNTKLSWLSSSLAAGQSFLRTQSAYPFIDLAVNIILNRIDEAIPKKMSRARVNRLKRQVREIIATETNLNPQWSYSTDQSDQFALSVTKQLNARLKSWWKGRAFPIKAIKEALQHAHTSSGYIHTGWEQGLFGSDEEDVGLRALGPMDVIPDNISREWDLQKANTVHIRLTEPLLKLKQLWPLQSHMLLADRFPMAQEGKAVGGSNFLSKTFKSPLFNALYGRPSSTKIDAPSTPFPEADVYWSYISDDSYNVTGDWLDSDQICFTDEDHRPLQDFGGVKTPTTYFYKIPPYSPGGQFSKKDCALYPTRRLIIWTRSAVLYDGPSYWRHGRVPVTKFSMDEWVFEYLGSCVIEENRETQASFTSILRYFLDSITLKLDPPTKWNEKEFSKEEVRKFKLRSVGERIRYSGLYPDPVSAVLPYQHYEPSMQTLPALQFLNELMDHCLGVNDFKSLQKLGQLPSAEGIDKILQSMSALMTDYALTTERSLTEVGYQVMWNSMQFDTKFRDNWNPNLLIPTNPLPGESEFINSSPFHKAIAWGKIFRFGIAPLSSFSITDSQQKLMIFQLFREPNFPMDPQTIAERWGLPNFGEIPGATILERWANWQKMKAPFLAQLQAEAMIIGAIGQAKSQIAGAATMQQGQQLMMQQAAQQDPRVAQLMQMAQQTGDPRILELAQQIAMNGGMPPGAGGGGAPPQITGPQEGVEAIPATEHVGRPPSGGAPPTLQSKDGGTRSTIAES